MVTKDEEYLNTIISTRVHFGCRAQAGGNARGGLEQGRSQGDSSIELHLSDEVTYNVMEYFNVFNHCINDLLQVEVKYEEENKALLLLLSLSSSFKHFHSCSARILFGFRRHHILCKYEQKMVMT